ncbi:hypothetical protein MPTK1_5g01460 [Marchantia polymorpha subsp. ruderalis]|nr:hypothetical protein MARPO_0175s0009 [Marchantia polymorpha]BBN10168.1 hypothetical protein Mp_5g01460 [Marchantia polymorpha subsp. ruderalis]|eukprot:PTQ28047.1 hypothetical protein MARPO_0175s0009 [Marchantia polymorpha]
MLLSERSELEIEGRCSMPGPASRRKFARELSFIDKSLLSRYTLKTRHGLHTERTTGFHLSTYRSNHHTTTCKATEGVKNKVKFAREELTAQQLEQWVEASKYLEGWGFDSEETDKILGKAFGWVHSPYWTEEMLQTMPEVKTISTVMDLAKSTGLTDDQLAAVVKKFPELLNCIDTIETNIGILDKEWGIKGNTLKNLIIRKPQVLGYNVDCKGDCVAQCTRCWVRF